MIKLYRLMFAIAVATTLQFTANAQSLSINTTGAAADPSAILDVTSTAKGMLIPRMDKTQKNAIATPATGLLIFQYAPDSTGFYYYNGTAWLWLATASANQGWLTTGNTGTDSAINFLGTLDNKPIMLRQNNLWMGQLNSRRHNYFIGGGSGQNNNTTASQNTGFGDSTLFNNTTAGSNTAMGYRSMVGSGPITGSLNTAMGNNTLASITTAFQNVAMGDFAMASMQTGGRNVVIGPGAMEGATKGLDNIALGLWALRTNDTSSANVAIGQSALYRNKRDNNVAIGYQAGYYNNYLQSNTLFGIENTYVGYGSGIFANTGSQNVALGHRALQGSGFFGGDVPTNTFYKRNVAIGDSALTLAYGSDNVAVGFKTLSKSSFTGQHVAVGSRALTNTTANYPNTAIGYSSQDSATTGYANTALGSYSLTSNKQGINNTAIGNAAMFEAVNTTSPTAVFDNTAVGNDALRLTRRSGQVAVGAGALRNDTSGFFNTGVGYLSLQNNLSGVLNTALGTSSMRNNTTGGGNTALGGNAMNNHKTGDYNTAVGYESMYSDTAGADNTSVGWRSYRYTLAGIANTAIGVGALEFTDSATGNTAIGRGAMIGTLGNTSALGYNTVVGFYAGAQMDSVDVVTAIGTHAGHNNRGRENTFVGYNSGYGFTPGFNLTGIENTGLGSHTLTLTSTGQANTAAGYGALNSNSTGSGNTAVGVRTLLNNVAGNYNVALGDSALLTNSSGSNNIAIGYKANMAAGNLTNASAIGSNAQVNQSNSMVLGSINGVNSATASTRVGIGTTTPDSTFSVADNFLVGSSGTVQYDNSVPVMNYMFKSGVSNADRMLIAHSPSFSTTGLQYQDVSDKFNFLRAGASVLTADLSNIRVGINTNSPAKLFHVFAGTSGALTNAASQVLMEDDASSYLEMSTPNIFENGILSSNVLGIRSAIVFRADSSMELRSGGNNATITLDNDNLVGIGTTVPSQKLHVIAPSTIRNAGLFESSSPNAHTINGATIYANNTYAGTVDVAAVKGRVVNTNKGYGVGGYFQGGYIGLWANTDNSNPGTGVFGTWGVYSAATQTTTNANYGVSGNTSGGATANYGIYGAASGASTTNFGIFATASGATTNWGGYFAGNVFTTGAYLPSDETLKSNIKNYDAGALSKIMSLQTKSYSYDVAKYKYMNLPSGDQFGFLAQDLEKVFPQLVTKAIQPAEYEQGSKNEKKLSDELHFKAVNYTGLIPVLTKAVQEQQQIIDNQQKAIDDLLKRVEKLEQK